MATYTGGGSLHGVYGKPPPARPPKLGAGVAALTRGGFRPNPKGSYTAAPRAPKQQIPTDKRTLGVLAKGGVSPTDVADYNAGRISNTELANRGLGRLRQQRVQTTRRQYAGSGQRILRSGVAVPTSNTLDRAFEDVVGGVADYAQALSKSPEGVKLAATHPIRVAKQFPGQIKQDFTDPRRWLFALTDVLPVAGAAGKIATAGRAASAASAAGESASRAFVRSYKIGPRPTRVLRHDGGEVQPVASPQPVTRLAEHAFDRLSERRSNLPVIGSRARVAARIPYELERRQARSLAPTIQLSAAAKKLKPAERIAYSFLKRYGPDHPAQATQFLDREIAFRKQRLAAGKVSGAERAGQTVKLLQYAVARKHILAPSDNLKAALGVGRELTGKAQTSRIERGAMTAGTAAERVNLPARIVAGEAAKLQPQLTLEDALKPVQELGGAKVGPHGSYERDVARLPTRSLMRRPLSLSQPREYVKQSKGILYSQGRFRVGPKVTVEDFAREARHRSQIDNVKQAARYAKPLNPDASPTGLEPGHTYFNPEGHRLPEAFKEQPAADQLLELAPKELDAKMKGQREALLRNTFPDEATVAQLPQKLRKKVGQIDERIKQAFVGRAPTMIGEHHVTRLVRDAFDLTNNVTKAALIYLKASFVPANFAGDVAFNVLQQGPWAGKNLLTAARVLGDLSPETVQRLRLESGEGPATAIAGGGPGHALIGPLAATSNRLASGLTRPAALIHEYAKFGITKDKQFQALFAKADAGDPAALRVVNQASEAGTKAIIDYGHLPPALRGAVQRLLFILPWIYGSTRYAVRLPLDRPAAARIAAGLGQQGNEDFIRKLGQIASHLSEIIPFGKPRQELGVTGVPVMNPRAATPFGSAIQVGEAAAGLFKRGTPPSGEPVQFLNPLARLGIELSTGYNTFTGRSYPSSTTKPQIAYQNTVGGYPLTRLVEGLINPKVQNTPLGGNAAKQPTYVPPTSKSAARVQALEKFANPFAIRDLNLGAAQAKGRLEARATMTPVQRAQDDGKIMRQRYLDAAKKAKLIPADATKLPAPVEDALAARQARYENYARHHIVNGQPDYQRRAFEADVALLLQYGRMDRQEANAALRWGRKATSDDLKAQRATLGRDPDYFGGQALTDAAHDLKDAGVKVGG